jgi:surface carbohydrate biosynthesis protein (TIGR04326 family)
LAWCYIFDEVDPEISYEGYAFDWSSYHDHDSVISIPLYVEREALRLRTRLIGLLNSLGALKVGSKSLVEHLEISNNFSLWWMSLPAERSMQKSPHLFDCLRLMALEELLEIHKSECIEYIGENKKNAECIQSLCASKEIKFSWRASKKVSKPKKNSFVRGVYEGLPCLAQGLIVVIKFSIKSWSLRQLLICYSTFSKRDITVFSYFIHLDKEKCSKGVFSSRHWGVVSSLLNKSDCGANWFHHYLESSEMPDKSTALKWVKKFNKESSENGLHSFFECYISAAVIFRVVKRLLGLSVKFLKLKNMHLQLANEKYPSWVWHILKLDIKDSICGRTAAQNLLWYELINAAMRSLPKQRLGLYLCENQGWEKAMIHLWRAHGHGKIIGIAHSSIRFWDIRYFHDPQIFNADARLNQPLPNKIAVNSPFAFNSLISSGYPKTRLLEVEAQRYLGYHHLNRAGFNAPKIKFDGLNISIINKKKILVLGDVMHKSTQRLMNLLVDAFPKLSDEFLIDVKPHPNCQIIESDYPSLKFHVINDPIIDIYGGYEIAIASNSTSAALDILLLGLNVIVYLLPGEINLSPVRGMQAIPFISSVDGLIEAIDDFQKKSINNEPFNYFWLDGQLPRWNALLRKN